MSREGPDCTFTDAAIAAWRTKLDKFDLCEHFGRRPCSIAKGVFATKAIKKIALNEKLAKINAYFNGENIDFEITMSSTGAVETTIDKTKITFQIVTIAALMEIIVLINSTPVADNTEAPTQAPTDDINDWEQGDDSAPDAFEMMEEQRLAKVSTEKNVLVKLDVVGNNVVMCAFLDNSTKKPIFMKHSNSLTVISGDAKKMSLLRLLFYAKKAKFEFCSENRDYRIKNLRDASELIKDKLDIWEKYFFVELSRDVLLLQRGIIFPTICAKVREIDPERIKIEWIIDTPYGRIEQQYMGDLLRANGRSIFIKSLGAVALTINQISVVRHVFCSDFDAALHKYMLYILISQNYILVDTSECKITHIDVGAVKFPLPKFLKNYQRDGIYAMQAILDAGCHCLLADEMGLGKTLQVLSLVCAKGEGKKALVICPASVISVWQHEITQFFPGKPFASVDKFFDFSQKYDFLLCSYAQVHKLNKELRELYFDFVVLDEAQYIKNPRSKTTLACCNLAGRYRIAMTGTPIENNLVDIWSIFRFLMPGFFCGYKQFQEKIGYQDFRNDFQKQLSIFTIRRTKQSVAIELPKRNEFELICDMTSGQQIAYNELKTNLKLKLKNAESNGGGGRMHMHILTALTRLRQAACAQFILPENLRHDNSRVSQKIDSLMIKLENIVASNKKAIVFSQFLDLLGEIGNRVSEHLPQAKRFVLTGSTVNRKDVVDDFQDCRGSAIMLISLKAGGVGITLHAAEYAFLMEPWWNPAVEEQAIARIHRIGQKNMTTVYRMITAGTIEENMRKIQTSKTELFKEFIKTGVDNIAMTNFYLKNLETLLE